MNTEYEQPLLKTFSTITKSLTDTSIPAGTYRAALGLRFEDYLDPNFAEYLVCQLMLDTRRELQEHSYTQPDILLYSAHFYHDPESGITSAIVLWKDNSCFDLDNGGDRYMVSEALINNTWGTPYHYQLLEAHRFAVRSENQITRSMIKNFEEFLAGGEYAGRTNLPS